MKAKPQSSINDVRENLIAKGLITPSRTPNTETVNCVRCEQPFERLKDRTFDTVCGTRACRHAKDAE